MSFLSNDKVHGEDKVQRKSVSICGSRRTVSQSGSMSKRLQGQDENFKRYRKNIFYSLTRLRRPIFFHFALNIVCPRVLQPFSFLDGNPCLRVSEISCSVQRAVNFEPMDGFPPFLFSNVRIRVFFQAIQSGG